jgi:hypothetical protein
MKYTLHGGSGAGISYYTKLLTCPKMASLDKQQATELMTLQGNLGIGTLFHAAMDLYFTGNVDVDLGDIEFESRGGLPVHVDELAIVEASRLFGWFKDRYAPDCFGEVAASELEVSSLDAAIVEGSSDIKFSAGIDLITHVDDEARARIAEQFGIKLNESGYYVIDHKTERALTMGLTDRFLYSHQMAAYQIVAKEHLGYDVKGALVNLIVKTKEPKHILIPIEYPSAIERKSLAAFWRAVERRLETPDEVNTNACFFPNVCRHFVTQACMRY